MAAGPDQGTKAITRYPNAASLPPPRRPEPRARAELGGLADVERDLIRTRTAEGRERAKARGVKMGRPPKFTPQQQKEARRRSAQGATLKELAKSYNVGRATISRLAA